MDTLVVTKRSQLTDIADAIRAKTGKSDEITLNDMPNEISEIGGGDKGFCYIDVESQMPNNVEIMVDISASVDVTAYRIEYETTNIDYSVISGKWFLHSNGVSATTDPVITYYFPVINGGTYMITMTEIGSRLRRASTTVDPSTITGNEGNIISNYVDDTSLLAAGYQFEYTATKDGWYLIYVSNQNEMPAISVTGTAPIYIEV